MLEKLRNLITKPYPLNAIPFSQTIRGQLTLWFVVAFILTFSIFVGIAGLIYSNSLTQQVDHHLETVLNEVVSLWHQAGDDRQPLIESLVASQGMVVMVIAPDGEIIFESTSPDTSLPTQHQLQQHLVMFREQKASDYHFFNLGQTRFALTSLPIRPTEGVVGVGFSTSIITETLRNTIIALSGLVIVAILVLAYLGYLLARRALDPVRTITLTAKNISTSKDLKDRIPPTGTKDEFSDLVAVLNDMISRLEKSFVVQQQFFADAAHSLKTPLTAVRTQLENVRGHNPDQVVQESVERSIKTIDQISKIVRDLLYLSRVSLPEFTKFEWVDLSGLMDEVCEITKALASKKKIQVQCRVESGLAVIGDHSLLLRGIINVVENAVNYTPTSGSITITAFRQNMQIRLTIKDTGIGIPQDQLDQVFTRFFRGRNVKDRLPGTGLGLPITKAIVQAHQGKIKISSQENSGTTAGIIFPA